MEVKLHNETRNEQLIDGGEWEKQIINDFVCRVKNSYHKNAELWRIGFH